MRTRTRGSALAVMVAVTWAAVIAASPPAAARATPEVPVQAGLGWRPFFDAGPLQESGWARCPEPIGVSIDTTKFGPETFSKLDVALTKAVNVWTSSSGLVFEFSGIVPMVHDPDSGVTSPADGLLRPRHLYLAMVSDRQSRALNKRIVGLGEPTTVDPANKEILAAEVTFEIDYVERSRPKELFALLTHEMGHALGLGHSADRRDIMYPIVRAAKRLGPGDVAGVRAITRPCGASSPSRDYALPAG